jgi:hypothetical protein
MSDQIEIKFSGQQIPPERFLVAVRNFIEIVQGVGRNITGKENPIQWTVESDRGSAVIRIRAKNRTKEAVEATDAIRRGFHSLKTGSRVVPRGFTVTELRKTQELADLADADFPISVKNGGDPEELSRDIWRTVDAMLRRDKYEDFGSIEGSLRSMTKGNRFECEIHDNQSGRTVHCYFTTDAVAAQAWAAFMKERVAAHGLIRYDKEGCPTSIVADTVRFFPEESELPTVEDIQAIFRSYK